MNEAEILLKATAILMIFSYAAFLWNALVKQYHEYELKRDLEIIQERKAKNLAAVKKWFATKVDDDF